MQLSQIKVALKTKPILESKSNDNDQSCLKYIPGSNQILILPDRSFTFDYVFNNKDSQKYLYETSVKPLVLEFLKGFNSTVMAYGQTGSGKTYTMGTDSFIESSDLIDETSGVIPRAFADIVSSLKSQKKSSADFIYQLEASFIELYNDEVIDLLNSNGSNNNLPVKHKINSVLKRKAENLNNKKLARSTSLSGAIFKSEKTKNENYLWSMVEKALVKNERDLFKFMNIGNSRRTTGSTEDNKFSSRSHAIFTLTLTQQSPELNLPVPNNKRSPTIQNLKKIVSKIHFVDLAGSERIKSTKSTGDRLKEGISINSGLLALGNVISSLGNALKKQLHIPYRNSKLTRLLEDSIGGNSLTLMIACITESKHNYNESLSTLRYANRARNIKNKVVISEQKVGSSEVYSLKMQIENLKKQLEDQKRINSLTPDSFSNENRISYNQTDEPKVQPNNYILHPLERRENRSNSGVKSIETINSQSKEFQSLEVILLNKKVSIMENEIKHLNDLLRLKENVSLISKSLPGSNNISGDKYEAIKSHHSNDKRYLNSQNNHDITQKVHARSKSDHSTERLRNFDKSSQVEKVSNNKRITRKKSTNSIVESIKSLKTFSKNIFKSNTSSSVKREPTGITSINKKEIEQYIQPEIDSPNKSKRHETNIDPNKMSFKIAKNKEMKPTSPLDPKKPEAFNNYQKNYKLASNTRNTNSYNATKLESFKQLLEINIGLHRKASRYYIELDQHIKRQNDLIEIQNLLFTKLANINSTQSQFSEISNRNSNSNTDSTNLQVASINNRVSRIDAELKYIDLKIKMTEQKLADIAAYFNVKQNPPTSPQTGESVTVVENIDKIHLDEFSAISSQLSLKELEYLAFSLSQEVLKLKIQIDKFKAEEEKLKSHNASLHSQIGVIRKVSVNIAAMYEQELLDLENLENKKVPRLSSSSSAFQSYGINSNISLDEYNYRMSLNNFESSEAKLGHNRNHNLYQIPAMSELKNSVESNMYKLQDTATATASDFDLTVPFFAENKVSKMTKRKPFHFNKRNSGFVQDGFTSINSIEINNYSSSLGDSEKTQTQSSVFKRKSMPIFHKPYQNPNLSSSSISLPIDKESSNAVKKKISVINIKPLMSRSSAPLLNSLANNSGKNKIVYNKNDVLSSKSRHSVYFSDVTLLKKQNPNIHTFTRFKDSSLIEIKDKSDNLIDSAASKKLSKHPDIEKLKLLTQGREYDSIQSQKKSFYKYNTIDSIQNVTLPNKRFGSSSGLQSQCLESLSSKDQNMLIINSNDSENPTNSLSNAASYRPPMGLLSNSYYGANKKKYSTVGYSGYNYNQSNNSIDRFTGMFSTASLEKSGSISRLDLVHRVKKRGILNSAIKMMSLTNLNDPNNGQIARLRQESRPCSSALTNSIVMRDSFFSNPKSNNDLNKEGIRIPNRTPEATFIDFEMYNEKLRSFSKISMESRKQLASVYKSIKTLDLNRNRGSDDSKNTFLMLQELNSSTHSGYQESEKNIEHASVSNEAKKPLDFRNRTNTNATRVNFSEAIDSEPVRFSSILNPITKSMSEDPRVNNTVTLNESRCRETDLASVPEKGIEADPNHIKARRSIKRDLSKYKINSSRILDKITQLEKSILSSDISLDIRGKIYGSMSNLGIKDINFQDNRTEDQVSKPQLEKNKRSSLSFTTSIGKSNSFGGYQPLVPFTSKALTPATDNMPFKDKENQFFDFVNSENFKNPARESCHNVNSEPEAAIESSNKQNDVCSKLNATFETEKDVYNQIPTKGLMSFDRKKNMYFNQTNDEAINYGSDRKDKVCTTEPEKHKNEIELHKSIPNSSTKEQKNVTGFNSGESGNNYLSDTSSFLSADSECQSDIFDSIYDTYSNINDYRKGSGLASQLHD
ncbi:hypothetical protein BB560_001475 [Smittium megazygosporum]|uniref:Kinesin motor domain-containing protein n=1 Tax=Smittium megazygosporum TaxID=133381 RepID=A0A2T9ZHI5_9FUNG|nr:hypothetical protein BB560_001475 [Smittium megazygosporum]